MKKYIVIHHSLTKDSETVSWGAIRRYHMNPDGPYRMRDVGYHAGIEMVGSDPEILLGRMPDRIGAHCRNAGMNRKGIGVCLVGNFDTEEPSIAMIDKLHQLISYWMRVFFIPRDNVIGHRDAGLMDGLNWEAGQFKTCPGKMFPLEEFKDSL